MSGTHLYYNGVLFRDCETLDFSSILEFDESGTHEKYMRTRITVASTLVSLYNRGASQPIAVENQHPSTIRIPPVLSSADETTPARLEEIMELLGEPRKDFWYAVNGVTDPLGTLTPTEVPNEDRGNNSSYRLILVSTGILPVPGESPADPYVVSEFVQSFGTNLDVKRVNVLDANNGPKPSGVGAVKLFGGNVMRIQATFEVCRVLSKPIADSDPGYDAQNVRGVVSNSWSAVDGLDDDGAVTHTVSGKMVVKDNRYKPNAMRMCAFPLAFPYARLVDRRYTVDQSGLVLEYQYQFKHAGAAPPQGIRKFEATYTEMAGLAGSAAGVHRASMSVKVMGWHDRSDGGTALLLREKAQKLLLIRGAITIVQSRLAGISKVWNPIPGQDPKTTWVMDSKIIERVGHPEIEMQVSVGYGNSNPTEFLNRVSNMGNPMPIPAYDPRWWPIDNEWGRLPDGSGGGNAGDIANPSFRHAAYPYAASGNPGNSDYFTGYFQPPGSNRHSLPRITGLTSSSEDTSNEWARPGGFVPDGANSDTSTALGQSQNPIAAPAFTATPSMNLYGAVVLGPLPPVTSSLFTGISDVQASGFTYISWASEVMTDSSQGKLQLPLSVPRTIPVAKRAALLGIPPSNAGGSKGQECSVTVSLCAPKTTRVYSVSSTRNQKWGQIPEPMPQIVRTTGSGSTKTITNIETLLHKEILGETPVLMPDGVTRQFTLHARYTYALANPWRASLIEGGIHTALSNTVARDDPFETLPVGNSPVDKATNQNNTIAVNASDDALFNGETNYDFGNT